jgi:hypothetical protein
MCRSAPGACQGARTNLHLGARTLWTGNARGAVADPRHGYCKIDAQMENCHGSSGVKPLAGTRRGETAGHHGACSDPGFRWMARTLPRLAWPFLHPSWFAIYDLLQTPCLTPCPTAPQLPVVAQTLDSSPTPRFRLLCEKVQLVSGSAANPWLPALYMRRFKSS